MMKTGWWHVQFDCSLEGEDTVFEDLDDMTQQHIVERILEGYRSGEIIEEYEDEEG